MNSNIEQILWKRAMGHPMVLEVLADCADCLDTESEAGYDPDACSGLPYTSVWGVVAKELREKAKQIKESEPDLWTT